MGRIKTQLIKRMSLKLFKDHRDELKNSFKDNKDMLSRFVNIPSKKLKNAIAGYITRLAKTKEELSKTTHQKLKIFEYDQKCSAFLTHQRRVA